MARLNTFKVQFHSYTDGAHELLFDVDDSFFKNFENSEIEHGHVDVQVMMTKSQRQLRFDVNLQGSIEVLCDRCLDTYLQPIENDFVLHGKFGHGVNENEFDVVWIPDGAGDVDLSGFIFEFITLSLPLKRVHPDLENGESGCDPDMLDRLSDIVITSDI